MVTCRWELDWVNRNKHLYDGEWHVAAVKGNIAKRYKIAELEAETENLKEAIKKLEHVE